MKPNCRSNCLVRSLSSCDASLVHRVPGADGRSLRKREDVSRHSVTITVNGARRQAEVESRRLLVHFLRDDLGVTSTHVGCDTTQCGACTVHLDGSAVKSCTVLAVQADGSAVNTVESLRRPGDAEHPLQSAFREHHALQCGFCTPGMIMSALELLRR